MSSVPVSTDITRTLHADRPPARLAFIGAAAWLGNYMPAPTRSFTPRGFDIDALSAEDAFDEFSRFQPDAIVVIDPPSLPPQTLDALEATPALTLGVLTSPEIAQSASPGAEGAVKLRLDRIACFDPALTGTRLYGTRVWRAIPPPIGDRFFAGVRLLHGTPKAMAIGRSTPHREAMLLPSKHEHDLLQVIGGLTADELRELLSEYDVGVYVAPHPGRAFGQQVPLHLASGHLLLSEDLEPAHGLEHDIDYLTIDSPEGLTRALRRLRRFPEHCRRVQLRGRMKAEHFRASRLFARLLYDLQTDVATFGATQRAADLGQAD